MHLWRVWGVLLFVISALEAFGVLKQHPENIHALVGLTTATIVLCLCDAVKVLKAKEGA